MRLVSLDLIVALCRAAEHTAKDYDSLAKDADNTTHNRDLGDRYCSLASNAWCAVEAGRARCTTHQTPQTCCACCAL